MKLLKRRIFRYETWAYTQITDLEYEKESNDKHSIMNQIIQSKWFIWQGEKHPNGMTWHITEESNGKIKDVENVKIHGYYNADLLDVNDFKKVSNEELLSTLNKCIKEHLDKSEACEIYLENINNSILERETKEIECYQLKKVAESKKSEIYIYSFFISFFIFYKNKKKVSLIEFGQD